MENMTFAEFINVYSSTCRELSLKEKTNPNFVYVTVVDDWVENVYVLYVKVVYKATDPYDDLLFELAENEDGPEDQYNHLLKLAKEGNCMTMEQLVRYQQQLYEKLNKDERERWIRL